MVSVKAEYRAGGKVQIKVGLADFAETKRGDTIMGAFVSKWEKGKCQTDKLGIGIAYDPGTNKANHVFVAHKGAKVEVGGAKASVKKNSVTISASAGKFARRGYDCAVFVTLSATGPETTALLDRGSVRLR